MDITFRAGGAADADAVAQLHADSWRRTYRGIYPDAYLDGDLLGDRRAVWSARLSDTERRPILILAEAASLAEAAGLAGTTLAGFVCIFAADDAAWGSLIDNLHVARAAQRTGVGRALMRAAGVALAGSHAAVPVHLFALEDNTAARAFYERIGGRNAGVEPHTTPGGGMANACRYAWDSPGALIAACET